MAKTRFCKHFNQSDQKKSQSLRTIMKRQLRTVPTNECRTSDTHINSLPVEIMLYIFSYIPLNDLYKNVRFVNYKWWLMASTPCLWKHIEAGPEISTNLLSSWLDMAPKLKSLELRTRLDAGVVLRKVSKCNKHLEDIKVHDCWGSLKQINIPSEPLCNLLTRCPNLNKISLSGSRFISCKFFKLLATRDSYLSGRKKQPKRKIDTITFFGNATLKQLRVFLAARKQANTHDLELVTVENNELVHEAMEIDDVMENSALERILE